MNYAEDLAAALPQAKVDFFRDVGDSADVLILDESKYLGIKVTLDDRGASMFQGLEVIFAKSPRHPVSLARAAPLFDDCEKCRGL